MDPRLRADALEYLWRIFPHHCIVLTDPATRVFIDLAIHRAARHGYLAGDDLHGYMALMLFFGSYFDEDPQLPWAAPLLARRPPIDQLFDAAVLTMEPLIGERGEHYRRALIWLRAQPYDSLAAKYEASSRLSLERWLSDAWERKFRSLPAPALSALLESIESRALSYGIDTTEGVFTFAALVFLLGYRVDRDPAHPWAGAALSAEALPPRAKALELHRQALAQLHRFMVLDRYMREN